MIREIIAIVGVNEDAVDEAPGFLFEEKIDGSGLSLDSWAIVDHDDENEWEQYLRYLVGWAIAHHYEEYKGMSPACYDEWKDCGADTYENTAL